MKQALLVSSLCCLIACGGGQKSTNTPDNPEPSSLQAELDAAKAELKQLQETVAMREAEAEKTPSTALNPDAINSVYEMEIKAEHFAEYLRSGQEFAAKARGIEGVLHYVLLKHPKKPNTIIWIERFANQEGQDNYKAKSGVSEAQAKVKHMIKGMGYVLSGAHESAE